MIRCRSRKSPECLDGQPEELTYPDGMSDDGTWDGESVVCDPCYIAIGQPSVPHDSPEAATFGASLEQPTRTGASDEARDD